MRARGWLSLTGVVAGLLVTGTLQAQPAQPQPAEPQPAAPQPAEPQPVPAPAGPTPEQTAQARKLFEDGRRLMQEPGKLDEACSTLSQSYKLHERGDTLLNLAECHRRQGKTTTAWREFDEAIRFAEEVEFPEAIEAAKRLRDELAVDLSVLTITLATEPTPPGLVLTVDGEPLSNTWLGLPLRLDPGVHKVTATAEGYEGFEASPELGPKGDRVALSLSLKKLPPPPAPPPPPPPPPPPVPEPVVEPEGPLLWPWIVTGSAGLVMSALSIGFGIDTMDVGDTLDTMCGVDRLDCPLDYDFDTDRAQELRSFGLFVGLGAAGVAALGVGITGLAVELAGGDAATEEVSVAPWVSPESAGIALRAKLP